MDDGCGAWVLIAQPNERIVDRQRFQIEEQAENAAREEARRRKVAYLGFEA